MDWTGFLSRVDLFDLWRWLLSLVCAVYTVVCVVRTGWSWLTYFSSSRETMVMGRYAMVLLLRVRIQRFGWELLQIAGLLATFGGIVYLHWVLV